MELPLNQKNESLLILIQTKMFEVMTALSQSKKKYLRNFQQLPLAVVPALNNNGMSYFIPA